jgi:hypothetical protein
VTTPPPAQNPPPTPPPGDSPADDTADGIAVAKVEASRMAARVVGGQRKSKGTVRVTLRNDGDALVRGPVTIKLYSSTDGSIGSSDLPLAGVTKKVRIKAGKSKTVSVKVKIPQPSADGDYFFLASVEPGSGVTVSQGLGRSDKALRIERPVVHLDGGAVQGGRGQEHFDPGDNVTVRVPLANSGNVAAKGKVTVELLAAGADGSNATPIATISNRAVSVNADGSKPLRLKFTLPESSPALSPGSHVLFVKLTATGALGDLNATDGAVVAQIPFVVA